MSKTPEQFTPRLAHKRSQTLLAAAVAALALTALPAGAQGNAGSSGMGNAGGNSASGAPGVTSSGTPHVGGSNASGTMVARDDVKMMSDLAQGNMAEIETGKLALEKSQNPEVKKFAQQMIDDHTSALQELRTLAQTKGVTLPDGTDMKHKTMAATMKVMNGNGFDAHYMRSAGVNDHQNTVQLLQKIQKNAKDADFKAMATKMLPTVRHHLQMAEQTAPQVARK